MRAKPDFSRLTRHWLLKLLSLVIGASLWYFVVGEDQVEMAVTVPIELHNLPADLVIANQYRKDIEVTVRGPRRLIQEVRQQHISRPVDLGKARPGSMVIQNDSTSIRFPQGIAVQRLQPANITLLVDRLVEKEFPITAVTRGKPAAGYVFEEVVLNPARIAVTGPQTYLAAETALETHRINLDGLHQSSQFQVHLNLSDALVKLIGETVVQANVVIREAMVRRRVEGIPVNARGYGQEGMRIVPPTVTVEADIPELVAQETPEPAMLFRAVLSGELDLETGELVVMVNGISLPGHAPIVIRSFTPQKVRIVR
jgi:YbbR domain-containing protein